MKDITYQLNTTCKWTLQIVYNQGCPGNFIEISTTKNEVFPILGFSCESRAVVWQFQGPPFLDKITVGAFEYQ